MPKAFAEWNVLPHDPIEQLAENVWTVEGDVPGMALRRRMTVARVRDGALLIHNAVALRDDAMAELEGWGVPRWLIVPNGWHRLDCANFKRRYPEVRVLCPAGARKHVEQVVTVDGSYDDFEPSGGVTLRHLDGLAQREGVLQVRSEDGVTLVFNDIFFNQPHLPGLGGLVMRLLGSTGFAGTTRIGRLFVIKDRPAYRRQLEALATDDLRRIVPGHGNVVLHDAAEVLRAAAARL